MKKILSHALSIRRWVEDNFVGEKGHLDPLEPWQIEFLDAVDNYKMPILANCCRGSGKSEIAACCATFQCLFRASQTILLVSPNFSQSREIYRRCRRLYDKYQSPAKPFLLTDSKISMELSNGSRIITLAGGNPISGRSYRSSMVICDEMSFCDRDMIEGSLVPSMAGVPGAKFLGISTPNGREGSIFYEWFSSEPGAFHKITLPANQSKRLTPEYLATQRAIMRPEKYQQEYECIFVSGGEQAYFAQSVIDRCFMDLTGDAPPVVA
jgi:hypothetical protein